MIVNENAFVKIIDTDTMYMEKKETKGNRSFNCKINLQKIFEA